MNNGHLVITEVYRSIQGESTRAGLPCVFVRCTGCHLRCCYCDSSYAFRDGRKRSIDELVAEVASHGVDLVEITGGEPLLQPAVHDLMRALCDGGHTVLLETSGACDLGACDERVIRIMDVKTPGSGEQDRMIWANLEHLGKRDEVKFVITDRADYEWARGVVEVHDLASRVEAVLFSPVSAQARNDEVAGCEALPPGDLAAWILGDGLPVRLQVQLHKHVWPGRLQGV